MAWVVSSLVSALGSACSRRQRRSEEERAFWEDLPSKKVPEAEEEEAGQDLGFEEAVHLKDEGKEKFARAGDEDVEEALKCWMRALDCLCEPPRAPEGEGQSPPPKFPPNDLKILELRVTLFLNMALGHRKLKQWRQAVNFCEEVLVDQPQNVKALYRKADSLGELCEWKEAEEAATKLEEAGEEGKKLAAQKREEWRRKRKAADGRQKKMWSAALSDKSEAPAEAVTEAAPRRRNGEVLEAWAPPKVEQMSVFDLRRKGFEWVESEDFDDVIWKEGLGIKEAVYYQRRALPLTLVAAASLAKVEMHSEMVVHLILDGNMAPFAEPHDWSMVLQRCPAVRSLTVIYVDIGIVGASQGPQQMPYGVLLPPSEEGRIGDRVARAARFLGTYREFKEHCADLPGLVVPHVALWADVPLYGLNDEDFSTRLETLELLDSSGAPSVVTQGGEVPMHGSPPMQLRVDDQASLSMAILALGLGATVIGGWWHWNRFVVPLDRGPRGVLAAHALLGTVKLDGGSGERPLPTAVKAELQRHGVEVAPYSVPQFSGGKDVGQLRKRQWEAFTQKLRAEGRPVGPEASPEEQQRQGMEFYQFCGMAGPPPH